MDRFSLMQTFVRVAETGSVSAAARDLRLGQPAISKHLQALETALNARLLQRSTQGIKLTEAGRRYYERAKRLVEDVRELESDFGDAQSEQLRGHLRVSMPVTLGELYLARMLAEFAARHPALELDLLLAENSLDLVETGVDIAIVAGRLGDSSLIARKLAVMRRVLVAAPAYLQRAGTPVSIEDLARLDFVRRGGARQHDVLEFHAEGIRSSVRTRGRLLVNNGLAVRELLMAGQGIAAVPLALVHADLEGGTLLHVLPGFELDASELHAVYPSSRFLPSKVRMLVHFLQDQLARVPGML
ncbi:MAG: LysR family transcriptional regulator [Pseudomonadota bacterium]|nr:LysR family transcriptional regulator [Pseudomonadota bacterium]